MRRSAPKLHNWSIRQHILKNSCNVSVLKSVRLWNFSRSRAFIECATVVSISGFTRECNRKVTRMSAMCPWDDFKRQSSFVFRQGGVLQKVSRIISEEQPAFNQRANASPKFWTCNLTSESTLNLYDSKKGSILSFKDWILMGFLDEIPSRCASVMPYKLIPVKETNAAKFAFKMEI